MSKIETVMIKHYFDDAEKLELGNEMSEAVNAKNQIEDEFKEVKASYKAQIEEQEHKCKIKARLIKDGWEHRRIECRVEPDFENKKMNYVDVLTGDIVKQRDLTADELQLNIE